MAMSPTRRAMALCKKRGWRAQVVEHWVTFKRKDAPLDENGMPKFNGIRRDLFGFIDIVALDGDVGLLGIQATTPSNIAARLNKIRSLEAAQHWLAARNRLVIWGWKRVRKNGKWSRSPMLVERVVDLEGLLV